MKQIARVLDAVASGANTLSDVVDVTALEPKVASVWLGRLRRDGVIRDTGRRMRLSPAGGRLAAVYELTGGGRAMKRAKPVLDAVAAGATTNREVAAATGLSARAASTWLSALKRDGLIRDSGSRVPLAKGGTASVVWEIVR